jgi:hypothetical protein
MKESPIEDAPNMVLSNEAGHLFLTGDGNNCHEQHLGQRIIDPSTVVHWRDHVHALIRLRSERSFDFCFLTATDKQSVYWPTLSSQPDQRNVLHLLKVLEPKLWLDPLPLLSEMALHPEQDPYPTVDTHWNTRGCFRVFKSLMERWQLACEPKAVEDRLTAQAFEGDLGRKLNPKRTGIAMNLDPRVWRPLLRYDNGIPDNGRIRVFFNQSAPIGGRLLLLGDSFSYRLSEIAAVYFREVLHFHGAHLDRNTIRLIQPDWFVFEQTDRFFIRPPRFSIDVPFFRLIEEKVEQGMDLADFVAQHRFVGGQRLASLHQSLIVDLSERQLQALGIGTRKCAPDGLESALRAWRVLG